VPGSSFCQQFYKNFEHLKLFAGHARIAWRGFAQSPSNQNLIQLKGRKS